MKPNFALSLSFEGIRLLHRGAGGWSVVGEVPLDAADLGAALAVLRRTGLALDPAGMRTKILLPNEQIRYLALDSARLQDSDVRAALDGTTPYAIEDLVYDFVHGGGRTHIAAVARETLAEAEAFAVEHGFAPVCFAAVPEPLGFHTAEPFFGPTTVAAKLLGPGETVERDAEPVRPARPPGRLAPRIGTSAAAAPTAPPSRAAAEGEAPVPRPARTAPEGGTEPAAMGGDGADSVRQAPAPAPVAAEPEPGPGPEPDRGTAGPPSRTAADAASAPPPATPAPATGTAEAEASSATARGPEPHAPASALGDAPGGTSPSDGPAPGAAALDPPAAKDEAPPARPDPAKTGIAGAEDAPAVAPAVAPGSAAPAGAEGASAVSAPAAAVAEGQAAPPEAALTPVFTSRSRPLRALAPGGVVPPAIRPVSAPDRGPPAEAAQPVFARRNRSAAGAVAPVPPAAASASAKAAAGAAAGAAASPPPPATAGTVPAAGVAEARRAAIQQALMAVGARAAPGAGRAPAASAPIVARAPAPPPAKGRTARAPTAPAAAPVVVPLRGRSLDDIDVEMPAPETTGPQSSAAAGAPQAGATGAAARQEARAAGRGIDRAARPARGRPRFLGLILTGILILFLGLVAWWASTPEGGAPGRIAAGTEAPAAVAVAPETLTAAEAETGAAPAAAEPDPAASGPEAATAAEATVAPGAGEPTGGDALASLPDPAFAAAAIPALLRPDAQTEAPPQAEGPAAPAAGAAAAAVEPAAAAAPGVLVTPAEAESFYARTGVWLRAPRLPLLPRTETVEDLALSAADPVLSVRMPVGLPGTGGLAPDPVLMPQRDPPPPGTVFDRDERGLIRALPEGIVLPTGIPLFAGAPQLKPPTRPGTVAPEPPPAPPAAGPPRPTIRLQPRPATLAVPAAASVGGVEPAVAAPDAAAGAAAVDGAVYAAVDAAATAEPAAATPGAVSLAAFDPDLRPRPRPAGIAPEPAPAPVAFDGPSPPLRPAGLAPAAAAAPAAEPSAAPAAASAAPAAPDVASVLEAIVANAADPLAGATAQAVPAARRPDARPRNFDRVVARQQERLARARTAAPAAPPGGVANNLLPEEQAEQAEEVSNATLAATGPVPGGVAAAATIADAINLRQINLIGVYGRPNDRRALVRLANGRFVRVGVGDSLDGGQVTAIGDNALNYVKRGRTEVLVVPGG
jgi:hypothetical protein